MAEGKKRPINLYKAARMTTLYIMVVTIAMTIIIPIYFLVSLSFLSTREAYQFPLPVTPRLTAELELTEGEKGYLLSIYEKRDGEYRTLLDTDDTEKMSHYMRQYLNVIMTPEEVQAMMSRVDAEGTIHFKHRVNWLNNYNTFFTVTRDAIPSLIRSLQIAGLTILISLTIGGMAGYAFARYIFKGRDALKFSVLFVRMFPGVAVAMPMVFILANMGLYDQPLGLSLVYAIGQIGLTVWITASIFMGIPTSLEEAAQVFGSSRLGAFMKVTLPLALPGLAACAMYAFLGAWNETVAAIILTQFKPTFAVVVYQTLLGATGQVNLAAAGGMAMALPAVIFTFFIRRYINQMWGGISV